MLKLPTEMIEQKLVYIGIGSNVGNRFQHIQSAIDSIHYEVGSIIEISCCYESPAIGFNGSDFINLCIGVRTFLPAELLLSKLLSIEDSNGRERFNDNNYHNRTIDLDLLLYDQDCISNDVLTVPHQRLEQRNFVLVPLSEIAGEVHHPKLNKSILKLRDECPSTLELKKQKKKLKNPLKKFNFSRYNFIAIEGNIGAGKTILTKMMANDFNAKILLERFAENPFLPKFYKDKDRFAFPLEMSFLADRFQQISEDIAQLDLFKDFIIADYEVYKSLIFSKITLSRDEFLLYRKLFYLVYKDIKRPDLYIFLNQDVDRLIENVKKRGREYESNLSKEYLKKINLGYLEFIKENSLKKVKIIDITGRDFVANRHDYLWLLSKIGE